MRRNPRNDSSESFYAAAQRDNALPRWGSVRFIDQVKAYRAGFLVTAEEVRALSGVLAADLRANKGVVTTTSDFAPRIRQDPSIAPFLPTRIELVNGTELVERLEALAKDDGS
jgi:restriction system protein